MTGGDGFGTTAIEVLATGPRLPAAFTSVQVMVIEPGVPAAWKVTLLTPGLVVLELSAPWPVTVQM